MLHQIDFYKMIETDRFDKAFSYESMPTAEMFWYQLFKTKTNFGIIKKINIYITDEEPENYSSEVKSIRTGFDFTRYYGLDTYNKKKLILDTVHENLLKIADKQQIDKDKLQQAYNYCIENNLENKWLLGGKLLKSPSKKYYAAIECYWETDFFQITAIVYDNKKNELFRKQLLKVAFDKPTGYLGYIYQYKPVWEVDTKNKEYLVFDIGNVFLKDQIKTKKWMINPDNQNVQTEDKEILSYLEDLEE